VIAAHLIVGARDEPYLPALLASLDGVVDVVLVNDNGGEADGANRAALAACGFARRGAMIVDRAPFVDFASARNRLLAIHAARDLGAWVAFVDADEVHGPAARTIAGNLHLVPDDVDFVDGYTWHFFRSFDYYTSIERRMTFFRFSKTLSWRNPVHEVLEGARGKRLALPYVYGHYGHVAPARRHAEKGRQYAALGGPGEAMDDGAVAAIDVAHYFRDFWKRALRFHGEHPAAVRAIEAAMRAENAADDAVTRRLVTAAQTPAVRGANLVRRVNFEYRWRGRALLPLARRIVRSAEPGRA
jgi:hypothetical protein